MDYAQIAKEARKKVLEMIFRGQSSHAGSNLSCIDLLTVLFEKIDLKKDKVLFSKGWVAASAYYFLAEKGIIPKKDLKRFCQNGEEKYIGLVEPSVPGIHFAGGSVGMGIPAGIGFALAKKIKGEEGHIYVLESDGGMQVGMTWESALIAAHHKLDNLTVLIDNNRFCAMGKTEEVLNIEPLQRKWLDFGWNANRIDGHNYGEIGTVLNSSFPQLPRVIIADTIKGKGVSFMESDNIWHYWHISKEDYKKAIKELNA